jgi:hypothetical protein
MPIISKINITYEPIMKLDPTNVIIDSVILASIKTRDMIS